MRYHNPLYNCATASCCIKNRIRFCYHRHRKMVCVRACVCVSVCVRHAFPASVRWTGECNADRSDSASDGSSEHHSPRPAIRSLGATLAAVRPLPTVTRSQPRSVSRDLRTDDGGAAGRRQRRTHVQHQRRRKRPVYSMTSLTITGLFSCLIRNGNSIGHTNNFG